ncbi:Glucoamylase (glucan-1,4-alpha-glucosidase), GH15 family [Arboricoccus pini]|uniref:Glucoamylase (Glucan-1,4-alpha-glucosidase), GH15 family n=1 Tax=Arboricoccus pini TaxID=1963835 RepID=A0A212QY00_9PROT|nr:glycoside hydrolase family 15 protein [Arboricoccus pini]SNB64607.1 Glucoamylase (glucan-1,4-alpha-glucosidase), GH15 family [Arboricoccus pini]
MPEAPSANLDLGLIGNCQIGALIDDWGRIVWSCMPRLDSDPIFDRLLDDGADVEDGFFAIEMENAVRCERHYIAKTAVLVTQVYDAAGRGLEITDFAPRFEQFGRTHRPAMLIRIIRPIKDSPRIRVRLRPRFGYGAIQPVRTRGTHHIRYQGDMFTARLTTCAPVSYVMAESLFRLHRPMHFILGPDEGLNRPIAEIANEFLEKTIGYWHRLIGHLHLPADWQEEVIRSAITLKLCSFEETGAIVAAHTTSLPEAPGEGRNWDYRYCWVRDALFVVRALNGLGTIETMGQYLVYLRDIVAESATGFLQPVYGIGLEPVLLEREVETLRGYRGNQPVRVGNQAFEHHQHDGYGSVILAVAQTFFDHRVAEPAGIDAFQALERLGEMARELYDKPDAGLWELRQNARIHTHSSMMCWAACDRLARIARQLGETERATYWSDSAAAIKAVILRRAWNESMQSFVSSFEGTDLDAALLLMPATGFIQAKDPRFLSTLAAIEQRLVNGPYVFRYREADDFGEPEHAFIVCSFWYIEALHRVGRRDEARELFKTMQGHANSLGLMSEHIDVKTGEMWGNLPQTYSHVGLITCALQLSRPWSDVV